MSTAPASGTIAPSGGLRLDTASALVIGAALALLVVPMCWTLATSVWATDEQGHGPIILAVAIWLMWTRRTHILSVTGDTAPVAGWSLLTFSMLLFAFGRSQDIITFAVLALILTLAALLLVFTGVEGLRRAAFPLFFLLFMIPLPEALVAAVTAPLKSAVSAVATSLLYAMGYPVGRAGVLMTVGPYQLLVADACAGLNSMFTLEALGLLYMNLMNYTHPVRNTLLAVLLIPIAFAANVVRVLVLVLVTFHFGDEAGQGFIHGFAGMTLFLVALVLMLITDRFLGLFLPSQRQRRTAARPATTAAAR